MPLTSAQEEEFKVEAERKAKCQGTARIRLEWLYFQDKDSTEHDTKRLDRKNIERLKAAFRKDCRRPDIKNHIPAVINQQDLATALQASSTLPERLLSNLNLTIGYPDLVFPAGFWLEYGRHRIQAAKEVLPVRDKWWVGGRSLSRW